MRIALWDIVKPLAARIRPHLGPGDEFVEIPEDPASPADVDVVIASRFTARDASRARFRMLQVPGAGTDKIDFAAVPPDAYICNAYDHEQPIAEYVFAAILDHVTGFVAMTRRIPKLGWGGAYFSRQAHGEVAGRTLGLVGLGHIGKAIARRAKAFDMEVMAVTATRRTSEPNVDWIATSDRLGELLEKSDFVILACPLSDSTRGMIGMRELKRMRPGALLINVARAEVIVEADLYAAMKDNVIAGAVLDTWYRYPASAADDTTTPSQYPFGELPNVLMTPHSAGWTDGVWTRRCRFFGENIACLREGRPLANIVRAPAGA